MSTGSCEQVVWNDAVPFPSLREREHLIRQKAPKRLGKISVLGVIRPLRP
jgi:hypothetical protein